ncbi:hypothetical protein LJK88_13595 [Paenibacillus sp. P26]|nr:hypothetical protein LJK88_13595 [Paenibacillus sp. P26]
MVNDEKSLIVYGDIVTTQAVLHNFVRQSSESGSDADLLVKPLDKERAQDWLCANVSDKRVLQIYGHPRPHYVNHRLLGVYAARTAALKSALAQNPGFMTNVNVGVMPPMEAALEQSLQIMIEDGLRVTAHCAETDVVDLDKPWHLLQASHLVINDELQAIQENIIPDSAFIHPSAEIQGKVVLGEGVMIGRNVQIKGNAIIGKGTVIDNGAVIGNNSVIGDDCVIANYCKIGDFSVIGNRNRIGHCAEFEGITFDQVSFTHYGEVFGVVGTATDIAAGVTIGVLRFDDLPQMQKVQGRTEYPEKFGNAVYFGDYSRTGIASLYMPGVKVGSNSVIGPAVLVEKDVPSHTLIHLDQQQLVKKNGELTVTAGDRNASMGAWPPILFKW